MTDLSKRLVSTLLQWDQASPDQIAGCTDDEIASLEKQFSVSLPSAYKHFLRTLGKGGGSFENDALLKMHTLAEARKQAEKMLIKIDKQLKKNSGCSEDFEDYDETEGPSEKQHVELKSPVILKPTDFVFLCGDYNFVYFDTTESDDPAVRVVEEDEEEPNTAIPSFTQWLAIVINQYANGGKLLKEQQERLNAMGIEP